MPPKSVGYQPTYLTSLTNLVCLVTKRIFHLILTLGHFLDFFLETISQAFAYFSPVAKIFAWHDHISHVLILLV